MPENDVEAALVTVLTAMGESYRDDIDANWCFGVLVPWPRGREHALTIRQTDTGFRATLREERRAYDVGSAVAPTVGEAIILVAAEAIDGR